MTQIQRLIEISCVDLDGQAAVLFYDMMSEALIVDPTDFFWSLSHDGQVDSKTVMDAAYTIRRFLEFISAIVSSKNLDNFYDDDLRKFRDLEFKFVMLSSKSKQKERIAKNTVNIRIRLVYRYLAWLQVNGRSSVGLIGRADCRILSSLPEEIRLDDTARIPRRSASRHRAQYERYPLAYRRIGASSKHTTKFFPTEEIRFAAISAIHESASSDYLAHRNALIIDIANTLGWRRESINSITRGQVAEAVRTVSTADYVSMCPAIQKFGYVETFDVPSWLLERMNHFSTQYLEPIAKAKQWKLSPKSAFFLGANGRPLKDRSITKIVSKAIREAGGPRFAALHAFRRKFTNDEINDETNHRLLAGLDTSAASIAASVSISLGHHNPDSVYAYVSRSISAERLKIDAEKRKHVASLEQEVVALKEQVKALERYTANLLNTASNRSVAKKTRR